MMFPAIRVATLAPLMVLSPLVALSAAGCNMETVPQGLYVVGNTIPDDNCTVKAQTGSNQQLRTTGVLDLSLGQRYEGYLLVKNAFPKLESMTDFSEQDLRLDGSTVTITGADITVRVSPALFLGDSQTKLAAAGLGVPMKVHVPVGVTVEPESVGVAVMDIIPPQVGAVLRALPAVAEGSDVDVVAEIVFSGYRADRSTVKSDPWEFPVRLCNNCTVQHIYDDGVARQPFQGENPLDASTIFGTGVCVLGEDNAVTNAACGALWGPDAGAGADACALERCLGNATTTLSCDTDATLIPAP